MPRILNSRYASNVDTLVIGIPDNGTTSGTETIDLSTFTLEPNTFYNLRAEVVGRAASPEILDFGTLSPFTSSIDYEDLNQAREALDWGSVADTFYAIGTFLLAIKQEGEGNALILSNQTNEHYYTTDTGATIKYSTTGKSLSLQITGTSGETIQWQTTISYTEEAY